MNLLSKVSNVKLAFSYYNNLPRFEQSTLIFIQPLNIDKFLLDCDRLSKDFAISDLMHLQPMQVVWLEA